MKVWGLNNITNDKCTKTKCGGQVVIVSKNTGMKMVILAM